jgi:hypothetical protein
MAIKHTDKHRRSFSSHRLSDQIVAGSWRPNADGSITIEACIEVEGPDGERWSESCVTIRLKPDDDGSAAWARKIRREKRDEFGQEIDE